MKLVVEFSKTLLFHVPSSNLTGVHTSAHKSAEKVQIVQYENEKK